jgi:hypothetical protein
VLLTELASLTINALIILRAISPTLGWLTGIPRLRLRDDWTTHHDTAIFATLRSRLEDDHSADRANSIGHLFRLSITTGRGLAALTAGDFREARESLVRLGKRRRNLDAAWRHLRQLGLLEGQPEEFSQVLAKARLAPSELVDPVRRSGSGRSQIAGGLFDRTRNGLRLQHFEDGRTARREAILGRPRGARGRYY